MCTHTIGSYQAAVCLKCCFYIAAIFHFGLLSLNCLWGFVWGEEPSHLYMRLKEEKQRWETCLCYYSFPLPLFLRASLSPMCFISSTLSLPFMHPQHVSPPLVFPQASNEGLIVVRTHRWMGNGAWEQGKRKWRWGTFPGCYVVYYKNTF